MMNTNFLQTPRYLVTAALLLVAVGCTVIRPVVGPMLTYTQIVEAKGASSAQVELNLGAGELKLSGDANELAKTDFIYNIVSWKPTVTYSVNNNYGNLVISQPNTSAVLPQNIRYEWDVKLNNGIPIDLKINIGAGKAVLNLSGLNLNAADIAGGAGDVQMDLSGAWAKTAKINFEGGVGKVSLRLPKNVGVRVTAEAALGSVKANGLTKEGDAYVNAAYGKSPVVLDISIKAGIGAVTLDVE